MQLAWQTYMHSNYSMERPYIEYGSEVKSQDSLHQLHEQNDGGKVQNNNS